MIKEIDKLINYINNENSFFHKKLASIKARLSEPFYSIELDLNELRSMVKPELADKDVKIPKVEIDL